MYEFQCFQELESLVSKMENEREKDLIIESRFHRLLIGNKGENIQKLRDEFAAVQISFPDLGSKSEIVKLRGPKDDVEKCSKIINKNVRELMENNYQVKVPIFKQFHKFIIGKSGASIRQIRSETETKIELPESGSESDMITVTGKKENVDKAVKRIQKIQEEMANVVTAEVTIPAKIHNTMIGSGGKLIQSVMDDCGGVSIKFPPPESKSDKVRQMFQIISSLLHRDECVSSQLTKMKTNRIPFLKRSDNCKCPPLLNFARAPFLVALLLSQVTVRGPKDDVEKAKKMLAELANEKQLSSMTCEVRAKPEHHKFLIGRHGSNVQAIRDKTGARIIFPGEKDKDREVITIVGTKDAVAAAKVELENKIKGLVSSAQMSSILTGFSISIDDIFTSEAF